MSNLHRWIALCLSGLMLAACSQQYPETCPSNTPVGLANADEIAGDDSLPFRFPLDESPVDKNRYFGWFGVSNECTANNMDCFEYPERLFHAAEDYKRPAGTPVFAMAEGIIHFSGRAGGYGWLILIDHPQVNLYSLYGHLSPSRWKLKSGTPVERGDLIAYLGDPDENGGSKEQPLDPHLHFGVRGGQINDYPAKGEWRYMGGWIKLCPQYSGWLQPSVVITGQEIPAGGYPQPEIGFWNRWGIEVIFSSIFLLSGVLMSINFSRQKSRYLILLPGAFITVASIALYKIGLVRIALLPAAGILTLVLGIYYFSRWSAPELHDHS